MSDLADVRRYLGEFISYMANTATEIHIWFITSKLMFIEPFNICFLKQVMDHIGEVIFGDYRVCPTRNIYFKEELRDYMHLIYYLLE